MSEHLDESINRIRQALLQGTNRMLNASSPEEELAVQAEVSVQIAEETLSYLGRTAFEATLGEDKEIGVVEDVVLAGADQVVDQPGDMLVSILDAGDGLEERVRTEGRDDDLDEFELDIEEIEDIIGDREPIIVLPSLMDRIERFTSVHDHKFGRTETVNDVLYGCRNASDEELTEKQRTLQQDIKIITEFSPSSNLYVHVYTPKEIHELAESLSLLRQKNRPDFDGVEADIIDVNMGRRAYVRHDQELAGVVRRASSTEDGRKGMQWTTLKNQAALASDRLGDSLEKSEERSEYRFRMIDPDLPAGDRKNLAVVYQFVADHFAYNVLLQRSIRHNNANQQAFVTNCSIIRDYMIEVADLIESIPGSMRMAIQVGRKNQVRKIHPKVQMRTLLASMEARLENGDKGSGMNKGYKHDTSAALNLQYRIAHFVDDINKFLSGEADGEVTVIDDDNLQIGLTQL